MVNIMIQVAIVAAFLAGLIAVLYGKELDYGSMFCWITIPIKSRFLTTLHSICWIVTMIAMITALVIAGSNKEFNVLFFVIGSAVLAFCWFYVVSLMHFALYGIVWLIKNFRCAKLKKWFFGPRD